MALYFAIMDATRALLDSLMGADRDAGKNSKKQSFKDDDICKHYLVWDCPHDMFSNQQGKAASTSPIGPCPKKHSEAMKERFRHDKDYDMYRRRYLADVLSMLRKLHSEVEVKLSRDKRRIKTGTSCSKETAEVVEGGALARKMLVDEKLQAAERIAAEGDVELSQKVIAEAEKLAQEHKRLARVKEVADTWVDEICDVCGREISWRAPEEIEARKTGRPHPHVMGSWHRGWLRVRESIEMLEKDIGSQELVAETNAGRTEEDRPRSSDERRSATRRNDGSRDEKRDEKREERHRGERRDRRARVRSRSRGRAKEAEDRSRSRGRRRSGDRSRSPRKSR